MSIVQDYFFPCPPTNNEGLALSLTTHNFKLLLHQVLLALYIIIKKRRMYGIESKNCFSEKRRHQLLLEVMRQHLQQTQHDTHTQKRW